MDGPARVRRRGRQDQESRAAVAPVLGVEVGEVLHEQCAEFLRLQQVRRGRAGAYCQQDFVRGCEG